MEKTGAVILAAGGSSRLGQPKQFLLHEGQMLLARAVDAAEECSPVVVVAGREGRRIADELSSRSVTVVHHAQWELGIGSSIRAGVARALQISPGLEALVILVCDQLHVTPELVNLLRETRVREGKPMVACNYADTVGVPALFARSLFPRLQCLDDQSGARQILLPSRDDVAIVPFPEGMIDIDTRADVLAHLGGGQA